MEDMCLAVYPQNGSSVDSTKVEHAMLLQGINIS